MKKKSLVQWICIISFLTCFNANLFGQHLNQENQVIRGICITNAGLLEIVSQLRMNGVMVNSEVLYIMNNGEAKQTLCDVCVPETHTSEAMSQIVKKLPGYIWEYEKPRNSILIRPTENPLSFVMLPSISETNKSLNEIFSNNVFKSTLFSKGFIFTKRRHQSRIWNRAMITIRFENGTLASFLNCLSEQLGEEVCWNLSRKRTLDSVNQIESFGIDFSTRSGGSIVLSNSYLADASLPKLLQEWDTGTTFNKSKVALEIATRYRTQGEIGKANEFLDKAEGVADDDLRWQQKYENLLSQKGYPRSREDKTEILADYEIFIQKCTDKEIKEQAELDMIGWYFELGMEDKFIRLLKTISQRGPQGKQFVADYYKKKRPNASALEVDGTIIVSYPYKGIEIDENDKVGSRSVIKVQNKVIKTTSGLCNVKTVTTNSFKNK